MVLDCGRAGVRCTLCCKGLKRHRLSVSGLWNSSFGEYSLKSFFLLGKAARKSTLCGSFPMIKQAEKIPASQFKAAEAFGTVIPKPVCSHKELIANATRLQTQ